MRLLRKASIRSAVAAVTFTASALLTGGAGAASAALDPTYCDFVDGTVYCGTVEFIYEGDPALPACIARWERAVRDCPLG